RNRKDRVDGDLGREIEEHSSDHDHGGGHLQQIVRAAVQEPLELIDVVVQDRHQPAGGGVLEVGHVELLDVGVSLLTQLVLQRLGQAAPLHAVQVLEDRLQSPDDQTDDREDEQL